jgi:hypothetical protein
MGGKRPREQMSHQCPSRGLLAVGSCKGKINGRGDMKTSKAILFPMIGIMKTKA